jgi:protease-4
MVLRLVSISLKALNFTRRLFANLLFLAVVVLVGLFLIGEKTPRVPENAVLFLEPTGTIVEQATESLFSSPLIGETALSETLLRDVVDAVDQAAKDERIKAIFMDLGKLESAGLSKLREIGAALKRFKAAGKPVIASADYYPQHSYYLAAYADRAYLQPMGLVMLTGFGVFQNYYKDAMDKLRVRFHIFKVGTYKSALEPFSRNSMSEYDRQAKQALLDVLWEIYTADVAAARGLDPAAVDDYVNRFPAHLAEAGGDAAELALSAKLVDGVKTRDQIRLELIALAGEDPKTKSYRKIDLADYVRVIRARETDHRPKVGVVVAQGIIRGGVQPAGTIGSDSLSALLRQARDDDAVKALVLRIDSPGGSSLASEAIRREIESTTRAGKPVIVSMSSMAASGGYWIASAADEIWADLATITGSIGIFGAFPTFEDSLKALGIQNDGVGTTRMADALNPNRAINPLAAESMQQMVAQGYRTFIRVVAEGRQMQAEDVEAVAEGRVWAGKTAATIGLVDHTGTFQDAVAAAARRAGVESYTVSFLEPELTTKERLLRKINQLVTGVLGGMPKHPLSGLWRTISDPLPDALMQLSDPLGCFAYCATCAQP